VKTDALVITPGKRKHMVEAVTSMTFADLPSLRRKYEVPDVHQRLINDHGIVTKGCASEEPVFRYSSKGPPLSCDVDEPYCEADRPSADESWMQASLEATRTRVLDGGSCLLLGAPGTCKTFQMRSLVAELREKGKRVVIIAKTHAACQNFGMGAVTADYFVAHSVRNGSVDADVLVVERAHAD
jgi:Cdc6-like AAA superfamily ATPase